MLKLLGLDVVFAAMGNLYLLLTLAVVCFVVWKGKTWKLKLLFATLVLAVALAPIAPEIYQGIQYRNKLAVAQTMFAERCKTAGEKIYKTVDNVEGIYLMKVRPQEVNFGEQFKMDDPYGSDFGADAYIQSFLRGSLKESVKDVREGPPRFGYPYVEAQDPKDGQRYRYTGGIKAVGKMDATAPNVQVDLRRDPNFDLSIFSYVMDRIAAPGQAPRYGVTYDDISTHEEREYWIAGSSLKVIDLLTNEVIAERIGYMVDWAQGSTAGQRSPWLFAANNACPDFHRNFKVLTGSSGHASSSQPGQTLDFVEKVLNPAK